MDTQPRPLIVVHPDATSPEIVASLAEAGYCVIVSAQPELITPFDVYPVAPMQAMLRAALQAIRAHTCDAVRADFGRRVAAELLAAQQPKDGDT